MKYIKTWGKYRDCVGEIRNERLAETRVGRWRDWMIKTNI